MRNDENLLSKLITILNEWPLII